ncbi:MAG: VTT domain-containing protein [Chthoniobacteraceae bacterium]
MKLLTDWLASSQDYFQNLGWIGVVAFAAMMALAGMAAVPMSPFAITAALCFGFGRGFVAVQLGTMLSAAVNFLVSRHLARARVQKRLAANGKFRAIDAAVGREGWKIVALIRFVPLPFGMVNYAFGLTAVRFWPYILATAVPILLPNAFFVWLGTTAQIGLEVATGTGRQRHPLEIGMMGLGVLAALAVLTYVTKIARRAIAQRDETLA